MSGESKKGVISRFIAKLRSLFARGASSVNVRMEGDSKRAVLEELFYDFNRSRSNVYWTNFFRGIFFGVGSILGGTIVVALLVSILSLFADLPGAVGEFVQYIVDIVNRSPRS